jgi:16S rRNA C1402 N4-methylase RsmH
MTAKRILNESDVISLEEVFRKYGEVSNAKRIAEMVFKERKLNGGFQNTG